MVALFTRAWIEIFSSTRADTGKTVALFTRAWIEISPTIRSVIPCDVALFTRAWIEIMKLQKSFSSSYGRPLHEGVD